MKIMDIDSPLMKGLSKMADLMWVNILTVVCCLPVVTIGAALTAMNYMALKIVRNEECYITKAYFKAFKENFKQATIIWLFYVVVTVMLVEDLFLAAQMQGVAGDIVRMVILAVCLIVLLSFMFVFPTQAKFSNPIKLTLRNAVYISVLQFPKTVLMILMYLVPYVLLYVSDMRLFPISFMFGLGLPAFLSAKLYDGFFKKLENQILEQNAGEGTEGGAENGEEMEEPIFSDEVVESDAEVVSAAKTE